MIDPETDKGYCFQMEDADGKKSYISHYLEENAFEELLEEQAGQDSSRSSMMTIALAAAAIVLLVFLSLILLYVLRRNKPRFR